MGSFRQFVDETKGRLFVNIVPLIGHGTTRIAVSGLKPGKMDAQGRENNLSWESVINKMSWKIAERFGFTERGRLSEGMFADVTVFDPNGLRVFPDEPGRSAEGISYVFVNGEEAVSDGVLTGARSGSMVLKK